ncbi:MAG: NCS2 family permease [bacterium]
MLNKFFHLQEKGTDIRTEIIAGITTFMTMAYIIFVNPIILGDAGLNPGAVMVATCLAAGLTTIVMGCYVNIPIALAPGMGLNAFFAYTVVGAMGLPWQIALGSVFISGIVFIILTVTKVREIIVYAIPLDLKRSITVGIGLFITLIGFKAGGIVVSNEATLVGLGNLAEPAAIITIFGLMFTVVLTALRVKGSILIGILVSTVVAMFLGVAKVPTGLSDIISLPPSIAPTFLQLDLMGALGIGLINIILTFTFVELFDTLGTLVGTLGRANLLDKEGKSPLLGKAMMVDAFAIPCGALLGTSTITAYVESGSGVAAGGRTGLTALTTGVLFLGALFLAPLAGLVPAAATAPALIIVGLFMMSSVTEIDFNDFTNGMPAFLTIVMMPFTYSIAYGIFFGILSYTTLKILTGRWKEVHWMMYVLAAIFVLKQVLALFGMHI